MTIYLHDVLYDIVCSQKSSRCCRMMERAFSSIFIFMIGSLGMMSGNAPIITLKGK
jgi:hypothetical protein